jgi:hypothetical protein
VQCSFKDEAREQLTNSSHQSTNEILDDIHYGLVQTPIGNQQSERIQLLFLSSIILDFLFLLSFSIII